MLHTSIMTKSRFSARSDTEKLAIHESGHALMFHALGVAISSVTIEACCEGERPTFEGCVRLASNSTNVCDVIAGTLAGPAASFSIALVPADNEAMQKFRSDQCTLHDIYSKQKDAGTWDEFWNRLQLFLGTWVRTWLLRYEDNVERFARQLLLAKTLTGKELERELSSAWNGIKPDPNQLHAEVALVLDRVLNDKHISLDQLAAPPNPR